MNTKALSLAAIGLSALLTGCWQKSVQPFYQESNVIRDARLIGVWHEADKPDDKGMTWTIVDGAGDRFVLGVKDGEIELEFDARLFELGGRRFLDLYSRKRSVSDIPAHHLFLVDRIEPSLTLRILSLDGVKKWIQDHPDSIAHVHSTDPDHPDKPDRGEMILTADTPALQRFILAHLKDPDFFEEPGDLRRVREP